MRIGIIFGGRSREREISFAGGRTVFDLLDKSIFTPVPVFIDSLGNFILLHWQYLYKGTIRDFYPPAKFLPPSPENFQVYIESLGKLPGEELEAIINEVGKPLQPHELKNHIDFAFLALHGPYGEDGSLQGILSFYDIPYSGSGILSSAIGINKAVQKSLTQHKFPSAKSRVISREQWLNSGLKQNLYKEIKAEFGFPVVLKASSQGSSIGVKILDEVSEDEFNKAFYRVFFIEEIIPSEWNESTLEQKVHFLRKMTEIQEGIGFPVKLKNATVYHPHQLLDLLDSICHRQEETVLVESLQTEPAVLIEEFISGKEFSCIVVQDQQGKAIALPPTEIRKKSKVFDYRSKYLPGISNKITPIEIPDEDIGLIRQACVDLYEFLGFNVYARIDGMIKDDGSMLLNDPNTTSGMLPSSFFFHQAAEIGLSPGQFLTYIIYTSLQERLKDSFHTHAYKNLLQMLDEKLDLKAQIEEQKSRVAVILGGYSSERHISVESGRNVYEKLSSSGKYDAFPVFLTGSVNDIQLYKLPLNILLKDNADDIAWKVKNFSKPPVIENIIEEGKNITSRFASSDYDFFPRQLSLDDLKSRADFVFIALHGRPGEDGTLQLELEKIGLPYNGSGYDSSQITINKFTTNNLLREKGLRVAENLLITRENWEQDKEQVLKEIQDRIQYPLIAKPADEGCSSAVKKIKTPEQLIDFAGLIFRDSIPLPDELARKFELKPSEEFPLKNNFVVEELISSKGAKKFIEITGGMLTTISPEGEVKYEVFEPSEALASEGILSLEEKFLAGEGQNITPARFDDNPENNREISDRVRQQLEKAAEIVHIEGYCRIDAFVRIFSPENIEVIFIEINSLPGLTPATCIFHQAAINNYKPHEFLDRIIEYGLNKKIKH